MSILQLTDVSMEFAGKPVLRSIELTVMEGDFVSIIGYSGTGKSTLINLLAGLLKPTSGQVRMHDAPIDGPGPERGVVFQNYSLLPWLTVTENIRLAVDQIFPKLSSADQAARTAEYVEMVNLTAAARKYPRELSGGMRQRVSLARTLAASPRVLLLDEPLSALDALTRATLQDEIVEIWQKNRTTVVWITNDPDEALLVADRVIPLLPGRDGATLGKDITVSLARPRDRRELQKHDVFKQLKIELVTTLLTAKRMDPQSSREFRIPDLIPEDLSIKRNLPFFNKPHPRRRSKLKRDHIQVESS